MRIRSWCSLSSLNSQLNSADRIATSACRSVLSGLSPGALMLYVTSIKRLHDVSYFIQLSVFQFYVIHVEQTGNYFANNKLCIRIEIPYNQMTCIGIECKSGCNRSQGHNNSTYVLVKKPICIQRYRFSGGAGNTLLRMQTGKFRSIWERPVTFSGLTFPLLRDAPAKRQRSSARRASVWNASPTGMLIESERSEHIAVEQIKRTQGPKPPRTDDYEKMYIAFKASAG